MVVGVVERSGGIGDRERLGGGLPVSEVIRSSHGGEVARFVDDRAALRIGSRHGRAPECLANEDLVRLIRVDVRVIGLLATAIERHRFVVDRVFDGREMGFRRAPAVAVVCAEPG